MIEIPRAALVAHEIAQEADFFSFGSNDLTQMTFGYSRDDVGSFLPKYMEKGILLDVSMAVSTFAPAWKGLYEVDYEGKAEPIERAW
jgi:phosphoenolpyruvate synthase/pyruvate phosphate dikinase